MMLDNRFARICAIGIGIVLLLSAAVGFWLTTANNPIGNCELKQSWVDKNGSFVNLRYADSVGEPSNESMVDEVDFSEESERGIEQEEGAVKKAPADQHVANPDADKDADSVNVTLHKESSHSLKEFRNASDEGSSGGGSV